MIFTMHKLYGTQISFYTRKAWIAMRLLGLPVDDRLKSLAIKDEVEAAVGGYAKMPVVQLPDGRWLKDSTAIAAQLSVQHPARSLVPTDPASSALLGLADDWMDEWFLMGAIAWRATDPEAQDWAADVVAGNLLGLWAGEPTPEAQLPTRQKIQGKIRHFLAGVGRNAGVVPETAEQARAFLWQSLDRIEAILRPSPYLGGARPCIADCSLWGYLDSTLLWEEPPAAHIRTEYPAIVAFHQRLRSLADQGEVGIYQWGDFSEITERMAPLLQSDAGGFADFLRANRQALETGETTITLGTMTLPIRPVVEQDRIARAGIIRNFTPDVQKRWMHEVGRWPLVHAYGE